MRPAAWFRRWSIVSGRTPERPSHVAAVRRRSCGVKCGQAAPGPEPRRAVRQPREPLPLRPGGEHPFRGAGQRPESLDDRESLRRQRGHGARGSSSSALPAGSTTTRESRAQGRASAWRAPLPAAAPSGGQGATPRRRSAVGESNSGQRTRSSSSVRTRSRGVST